LVVKKYQYKGGDEFNNSLKKKIVSLYIVMEDKSSNKKTKKNDSVGVNLKFDKDDDRTWVNKDKFDEFESEYQQSQDDSSLSNTSSIEFEIHIKMVKIETKLEEIKKMDTIDYCIWWNERC
jgi:hypothetical protein